jgi:hypothetical protein
MQIEKKYWLPGMLNGDAADFKVGPDEYINCQDFRIGTTSDKGFAEQLESVGSTLLIANSNLPIFGVNTCIGTAIDYPNRRAVFFLYNSDGLHTIHLYDYLSNTISLLLSNSDVTTGLNFDVNHLIHSARVENGCVYWTDNLNEPRRFDINAALGLNDPFKAPLTPIDITSQYAVVGGFLNVTYILSDYDPPIIYGPSTLLNLIRGGTAGPNAGITSLRIPLDWSVYPATPYYTVLMDGIANYLEGIDPTHTFWSVAPLPNPEVGQTSFRVNISQTWDWGLGDPLFAPTTELKMDIISLDTAPYLSPMDESVIAWIRRQPGLPPTQTKVLVTPLPGANFIANEAFQFCYRYQYRNYEYSTLSGLSTLADFNEPDPPPVETSLNIQNIELITNGYLATTYVLTRAPLPGYGPNVYAKITRAGTGGASAGATDIPIPLDWSKYPATQSYTSVIVNGLNNYFKNLPGNGSPGTLTGGNLPESIPQGGKWFLSSRDGVNPALAIQETWDWGLGDSAFPPTTQATLTLFTSAPVASKQFSYVDIQIPLAERIDQDVIEIDLIANYLVSGIYFIIKSWKTIIAADAAAIALHNSDVQPLEYLFYNNQAGIAIDAAYAVKPFDSVPLTCQTIEMAKNRGFMGNYITGYTSSNLITSLAVTPDITVQGAGVGTYITGEWFALVYESVRFGSPARHVYYMRSTRSIVTMPPSPYYYYTIANAAPTFPVSITTGIIFLGTTISAVLNYYTGLFGDPPNVLVISNSDMGVSSALLSQNETINFGVITKAFKSNSNYQLGITFYDNYGRKCGVVTNTNLLVTIPNTGFSANQYATALNWTLSNANGFEEIPPWAYYYSINITKCLRTRFFVEAVGFVVYASLSATNTYLFTQLSYSSDWAGVAIDISFLQSNGMGYIYSSGDVVNFFLSGSYYSLNIIGQSAQYIVATLFDIGELGSGALAFYEIYTPYKQSTTEPYFEVGEIFPIVNPGTGNPQYSLIAGTVAGDVFLFQRENNSITYVAEAMSPNNLYYTSWFTDAGRPNFIDYIGQVQLLSSVCYSNTFIAGTENNGLSTFDALDETDLSPDLGPIMKLQLTSKVSKIGTIMLAICGGSETASLYLSENTLISNTGDSVVAQANSVIGSVHELKGEFGTLNPESVVEFRGNVYWFDAQNGKIIQYADNGLFPISNYKLSRYWKLFSDAYKSLTATEIEALGSRPYVFGCADPHHGEVMWTVPTVLATPPNGYLPDYPSTVYPFDIWDGMAKTIVYKLYTDPNKWQGSYRFTPEYMFNLENNVFAFKNGQLYVHNQSTLPYTNYYGVQYSPSIMFLSNQLLNKPKVYNNFSVEGSAAPSLAYFMSLYQYLQSSDLVASDFKDLEGVWYAPIYRNKLDPAFGGNYPLALTGGEKMRTAALYIMAQWDATQGIVQIKFCNVGYTVALGQKV